MEISGNILDTDREGFRRWLEENSATEMSCWVVCHRGAPREGVFCYIDAVEEALCFGWIDSTSKKDGGKAYRRFSPRRPGSHWTEMNKARVRRLERLGLMTDAGRAVLPDMDSAPRTDPNIGRWFREHPDMEERFLSFPRLYRDIQMSNLEFYREFLPGEYRKKLKSFRRRIETGSMVAGWDDYGRLTDADCAPGGRRAVTGKQ
jgi:hypothetical protein